jgi:hypothetical protein
VDAHVRLVADDDRVVSGADLEQVAGADLDDPAVGHLDPVVTRQHEPEVRHLAGGLAPRCTDVRRPAPARFVLGAADGHAANLHELEPAQWKLATFVGVVEAADDGCGLRHELQVPPSSSA